MNWEEQELLTVQEVASFARQHGLDVNEFINHSMFINGERWICFWRKWAALPGTGRSEEPEGTLKYNLQGSVKVLPASLKNSENSFRGFWSESGSLLHVEDAYELLKAWLFDWKEVDELPIRSIWRSGL